MARAAKKPVVAKSLEQRLWDAADALRGNQEPSEYKHVVLGLVFLKYISDRFTTRRSQLESELIADGIPEERRGDFLEARDEYASHNVFWVPAEARWGAIQAKAKLPSIGTDIDTAMDLIEKENPVIRGVLPRNYGREGLDKGRLGQLVDLIGSIGFTETDDHGSDDVLGRVYEYFLGQFAGKETGKDAGAFYTPRAVVRTLVEMLEPYEGRVYDPACGSGGMFVESAKFIEAHGGNSSSISVYGQEFTDTTWRLARMNLALRGIEADLGERSADSFTQDLHPDLRADFILANPPFNVSNWWDTRLADDPRWQFGTPPEGNANFAWAQHFIHHLGPSGRAAFVLANMSLASDDNNERQIREGIVRDNLVDCIVTLPDRLFLNTPISVSLWFLDRGRDKRERSDVLFLDASRASVALTRTLNTISQETIDGLAGMYRAWRANGDLLQPPSGVLAASVTVSDVLRRRSILLPAAHVDHPDESRETSVPISSALTGPAIGEVMAAIKSVKGLALDLERRLSEIGVGLDQADVEFRHLRIGELVVPSDERLGAGPEPEVLTCTEAAGLMLQKERFAKRVATKDASKYKVVRRGDIVYNPYLLWKGSIDQCWIVSEGITSPAYEVFRVQDGFDPVIVGKLLTSPEMIQRYGGISFGTVERRRRASPSNFLDLELSYPVGSAADLVSGLVRDLRSLQQEGRSIERGARSAVDEILSALVAMTSPASGSSDKT